MQQRKRRKRKMIDVDFRKLWGMVVAFVVAVLVCAVLEVLMGSCTRTVYMPVESVKHDSVRVVDVRVDSVMLRDSVFVKESGDTVFYYKWKTEYRYKERVDTCWASRVDSIQVPYRVVEYRNVIPKSMWTCVCVMGMAIIGLVVYIRVRKLL